MLKFQELTSNQMWAFGLGLFAAMLYWFQLLLLTQAKLSFGPNQWIGLAFAILISALSWLRFVTTTAGSFRS